MVNECGVPAAQGTKRALLFLGRSAQCGGETLLQWGEEERMGEGETGSSLGESATLLTGCAKKPSAVGTRRPPPRGHSVHTGTVCGCCSVSGNKTCTGWLGGGQSARGRALVAVFWTRKQVSLLQSPSGSGKAAVSLPTAGRFSPSTALHAKHSHPSAAEGWGRTAPAMHAP